MAKKEVTIEAQVTKAEESAEQLSNLEGSAIGALLAAGGLGNTIAGLETILGQFDAGTIGAQLKPLENQFRNIDKIIKGINDKIAVLPDKTKGQDSVNLITEIAKENRTVDWDRTHNGSRGVKYEDYMSRINQHDIALAAVQAINKGLIQENPAQLANLFKNTNLKNGFDKKTFTSEVTQGVDRTDIRYIRILIAEVRNAIESFHESVNSKTVQLKNITDYIQQQRSNTYANLSKKAREEKLNAPVTLNEFSTAAATLTKQGVNTLSPGALARAFIDQNNGKDKHGNQLIFGDIQKKIQDSFTSQGISNPVLDFINELTSKITVQLNSASGNISDVVQDVISNVEEKVKTGINNINAKVESTFNKDTSTTEKNEPTESQEKDLEEVKKSFEQEKYDSIDKEAETLKDAAEQIKEDSTKNEASASNLQEAQSALEEAKAESIKAETDDINKAVDEIKQESQKSESSSVDTKKASEELSRAKDEFYEDTSKDFESIKDDLKDGMSDSNFKEIESQMKDLSLGEMMEKLAKKVYNLEQELFDELKELNGIKFSDKDDIVSVVTKFKENISLGMKNFDFDDIIKSVKDKYKLSDSLLTGDERLKGVVSDLGNFVHKYTDGYFDITTTEGFRDFAIAAKNLSETITKITGVAAGKPAAEAANKTSNAIERVSKLEALLNAGLFQPFQEALAKSKIFKVANQEFFTKLKALEEYSKGLNSISRTYSLRYGPNSSNGNPEHKKRGYEPWEDSFFDSLSRMNDQVKYRRGFSGLFLRTLDRSTRNKKFGDVHALRDQSTGEIISGSGVNMHTLAWGAAIVGVEKLFKVVVNLGKEAMRAYGEIQSIRTNLGVVYGNQSEADVMFNDIANYAVKSPFGVQQVSEFAVLLKQSGIYSSDLLHTLKMIGDVSGGNAEKMKRIANNYAQIAAMGKANSLDLRQFANAGIPIYELLRSQLGVSQKELRKKASAGEITSEVIAQAFESATSEGGRFYKAVDKGAKTYKAQMQNLADARQLGMASLGEWGFNLGKNGNEKSIAQFWLDTIETFYNDVIKSPFENRATKINTNSAIADYEDYKTLIGLSAYIENNSLALAENTEFTKLLSNNIESLYDSYIDNARTIESKIYIDEVQKLEKEIGNYQMAKELKAEYDKYEKERDLKMYGDPNDRNAVTASYYKMEEINKQFQKDTKGIVLSLQRLGIKDPSKNINSYDKIIETDQNKLKELRDSDRYKWYLQYMSLEGATGVYEAFAKNSKNKNSAKFINDALAESYKSTDSYKKEEALEKEDSIKNAYDTIRLQKLYNVKDSSFSWLKPAWNKEENAYQSKFMGKDDLADFLNKFYSETERFDFGAEKLTGKTVKSVLDNIGNIKEAAKGYISQEYFLKVKDFEGALQESLEALNKTPASDTIKRNSIKQRISEHIGDYYAWIKDIEDESTKTILSAILLNPQANLVSEKEINAINKENSKKYMSFWKRFSVSALGISSEALFEEMYRGGKAKDVIPKLVKNKDQRATSENVISAILGTGVRASNLYKMILPSNTPGDIKGSMGLSTSQMNQEELFNKTRNIAMSSDMTVSGIAATSALLSSLESSIKSLDTFYAGAITKSEDMDKLYDSEWAKRFGYTNKESLVSAFGADATVESKDGIIKFNSALLKSLETYRDQQLALKDSIQGLNGFKNAVKDLSNEIKKSSYGFAARSYISNNDSIKNLSSEAKTELFNKVGSILEKNGQAASSDDIIKWIDTYTKGDDISKEITSQLSEKFQEAIAKRDVLNKLQSKRDTALKFQKTYSDANSWYGDIWNKGASGDAALENLFKFVSSNTTEDSNKRIAEEFEKRSKKAEDDINKYAVANAEYEKAQLAYDGMNSATVEIKAVFEKLVRLLSANDNNKQLTGLYNYIAPEMLNNGWKKSVSSELWHTVFSGTTLESFFPEKLEKGKKGKDGYEAQSITSTRASSYLGVNSAKDSITNYLSKDSEGNALTSTQTKGNMQSLYNSLNDDPFAAFGKGSEYLQQMDEMLKSVGDNIDGLDVGKFSELSEKILSGAQSTKSLAGAFASLGNTIISEFEKAITTGLTNTFKIMGKTLTDSTKSAADGAKEIGKAWKEVAQNMLDALGPAMTQAGLQMLPTNPTAGLALIGAGGIISFLSGMLEGTDEKDKEKADRDELARLQNIKDVLSDLIDQAKTDAEYYQKNYLHKNALSRNSDINAGNVKKVNDAIITPSGNVISTAPDDYLIATKTPDTLVNNSRGSGAAEVNVNPIVNIGVYNQSGTKIENADVKQTQDEYGNIDIQMIIKQVGAQAIADGDWDDAFAVKQANDSGRSVAW